jgi:hypothetical protein
MNRALVTVGGTLVAVAGLAWAGLQVQPAPFATVPPSAAAIATVPLPAGLPAPVERFYRLTYGERIPVFTSAVISGRGTMRPVAGGPALPMRFRFVHEAGHSYRHYMEATFFGLPILKANEYYVDGRERMELPWGVSEGPTYDQAGNLGMWGELSSLPAALLTDERVRWAPVDEATALLVVPFGEAEETFVARFDPGSGRLVALEAMRFKDATPQKTLWIAGSSGWGEVGGYPLAPHGSATWLDDGTPWLELTIEEIAYNVPVDTSFGAKGP